MSGHSSITTVIIPVSLVTVSFLLLVNIWSTKTSNQILSEDVGRAEAELEMASYQGEFCVKEVKEKEEEIKVNVAEVTNLQNQLRKALDARAKLVFTRNIARTQVNKVRAEKENTIGSGIQLEKALEEIRGDLKKQESIKKDLNDNKNNLESKL